MGLHCKFYPVNSPDTHGAWEMRQQIIFKGIADLLLCSSTLLSFVVPSPFITSSHHPSRSRVNVVLHNVQFVSFSFLKAPDTLSLTVLLPFSVTLVSAMRNALLFLCSRQRLIFGFLNIPQAVAKFPVALCTHFSLSCG